MKKLLILIILLIISSCVKETDCGVWKGFYPGMPVSNLNSILDTHISNSTLSKPKNFKKGKYADDIKRYNIGVSVYLIEGICYRFTKVDDKVSSIEIKTDKNTAKEFYIFIKTNDFYKLHSADSDRIFYFTRYYKLLSGKKNNTLVWISKDKFNSPPYKITWQNTFLEDNFKKRFSEFKKEIYFD